MNNLLHSSKNCNTETNYLLDSIKVGNKVENVIVWEIYKIHIKYNYCSRTDVYLKRNDWKDIFENKRLMRKEKKILMLNFHW